ncbi:MAG: hypothetical protein PVF58_14150 [Candidatus Methanofastidiosia archaeon]
MRKFKEGILNEIILLSKGQNYGIEDFTFSYLQFTCPACHRIVEFKNVQLNDEKHCRFCGKLFEFSVQPVILHTGEGVL